MIADALSVLRAEVQIDPTGRPNLVPNPSGDGGSWFWTTPLRFTKISSVSGALRLSTATGVGDAYTQTNPIRLAAGDYIAARFDTVGGTSGHKVKARFRFFDLAGNLIDTSTPTAGFDTTAGTHYRTAVQAPAGTSFAKLKLDLYDGASPPAANAHYDFNNVMVTTDSSTFGIPFTFTEPVEYTNILGPTNNITITRAAMEPGVIGVRIIDTSLDPADADALRTGRLFRITALNNDTSDFEDLAARLYIIRAEVSYDLKKPPDKQATISLTLTDSLQLLANSNRPVSIGTIDELPFVLETVGIPFNVNGATGTLLDDPIVTARIDGASALDQVLLVRDTNQGYAWVSKSGVLNAWTDRGTDFYGGAVTFDESSYSSIDVGFDTDNCINEVLIVRVVINPANGETVEQTYGPFRDEAAVDRWKVVRQATFRVTGIAAADVPAFAADVLANRSEPVRRVNSVTVPIRTLEDITTAKALIDLYATANITNAAKGLDLNQHVTSISHSIQCTAKGVRWIMTLGFDVAESVSSPAPTGGASGAANVPPPNPSSNIFGINTDRAYAPTDDAAAQLLLSYLPISGTLTIKQNGNDLHPDDWDRTLRLVTVEPAAELPIRAGDSLHAVYLYNPSTQVAADITYRDASSGIDAWTIPSLTEFEDLLVAVAMVPTGVTVTENGWTLVGESADVTHGTAHGPFTYRLVLLSKVYDGTSTVPTVPAGPPSAVCLMAAFDGGSVVAAVFDTVADDDTANTPATDPSSLRVWGILADSQTITPAAGTPVAATGGTDIDIAMTLDSDTGPRAASVALTAGWCLASLTVY